MANMTEFGKTPFIAAQEFQRLGYKLVIFPVTAFRVMLKAVDEVYRELVQKGSQQGFISRMMTRQELYDLLSYDQTQEVMDSAARKAATLVRELPRSGS
jgi:methylisocitrate lyase